MCITLHCSRHDPAAYISAATFATAVAADTAVTVNIQRTPSSHKPLPSRSQTLHFDIGPYVERRLFRPNCIPPESCVTPRRCLFSRLGGTSAEMLSSFRGIVDLPLLPTLLSMQPSW